jgi:hypothetical protein
VCNPGPLATNQRVVAAVLGPAPHAHPIRAGGITRALERMRAHVALADGPVPPSTSVKSSRAGAAGQRQQAHAQPGAVKPPEGYPFDSATYRKALPTAMLRAARLSPPRGSGSSDTSLDSEDERPASESESEGLGRPLMWALHGPSPDTSGPRGHAARVSVLPPTLAAAPNPGDNTDDDDAARAGKVAVTGPQRTLAFPTVPPVRAPPRGSGTGGDLAVRCTALADALEAHRQHVAVELFGARVLYLNKARLAELPSCHGQAGSAAGGGGGDELRGVCDFFFFFFFS